MQKVQVKSANLFALAIITVLVVTIGSGCNWFGGGPDLARPRHGAAPIMGQGAADSRQLAKLLCSKNARIGFEKARKFAMIYIQESRAEGVNSDVAFVQMCLETDFLRFGGQVQAGQNNFCGLGATDDGAAGASFPTVRAGVRAHIQHLKAYASRDPVRSRIIDPRFKLVERGSAPYVKHLAGTWATDPHYARKIKRLLARLRQT